ncbi:hypothetical protein ACM61V_02345 [Sphingomonas sp. TX0543]|nr:hypothetical protein [Sphingomonas sp. 3P27F8]
MALNDAAPRRDAEIKRYADGIADMFCAYLERLNGIEGRAADQTMPTPRK